MELVLITTTTRKEKKKLKKVSQAISDKLLVSCFYQQTAVKVFVFLFVLSWFFFFFFFFFFGGFKGVLHPRLVFGLFLHFSQKLQHIGDK